MIYAICALTALTFGLTGGLVLVLGRAAARGDALVAQLLEREDVHREERQRTVSALLAEQDKLVSAHEAEKDVWREERADLLNVSLGLAQAQPVTAVGGWPDGPPQKLSHTEEDEIAEARQQTAAAIEAELAARSTFAPDALGAA